MTPIASQTFKMLKTYGDATKFKKEALRILLNQLRENDIRVLTKQFETMDQDKNGIITVEDLQAALTRQGLG